MKIFESVNKTYRERSTYSQKDIYLKVKIRSCLKRDLKKLEWFGMFRDHRNIFVRQFQRHLKNENLMLVAELNNFPIGQIWIDWQILLNESTALIWALRVHPIMQNQGVGTLLIKNSENLIRVRNYMYSQLYVHKDNLKAILLYKRLGYKILDKQEESLSFAPPDEHIIEQKSDFFKMKKNLRM